MQHLTPKAAAERRRQREAATLRRLFALNDPELDALIDALRDAVEAAARLHDLSPDLWARRGPKAKALPQVMISLYLREVGSFTKDELAAHLAQTAEPTMVKHYLRQMGLGALAADDVVPRPRVFPRAMLVVDFVHTAKLGKATVHGALQFLSRTHLTTEEKAGPSGALDLQVRRAFLELVEDAVMTLPTIGPEGFRFDIARKVRGPSLIILLAILFGLAPAHPVRAAEPAAVALAYADAVQPAQVAYVQSRDAQAAFGASIASECGPSVTPCTALPGYVIEASMRDVLDSGRRLLGPAPQPAPVDPNDLSMVGAPAAMPIADGIGSKAVSDFAAAAVLVMDAGAALR